MRAIPCVVFLLLAGPVWGQSLPTGIPTPPFGLTETVGSTVGSGDDNYYTHWVDNTNGGCSDAGNGTPATPRCSLPTLTGLAAGSVVQLRGGPYTGAVVQVSGVGTAGSPIFIRGGSAASPVELRMAMAVTGNADYLVVENLKWTTVDESVFTITPQVDGQTAQRVVLRDSELVGNGADTGNGAAISASAGVAARTVQNILFLRVTVHDFGDWAAATENDKHCFTAGQYTHHVWVLDSTAYHCAGDAIQVGHDHTQATNAAHDIFIGGNTFRNNGENAIDIKQIYNVIISENEMYGPFGVAPYIDDNQAVVLHYGCSSTCGTGNDVGPYNVWVINNYIHDAKWGIVNSKNNATLPNWFIGNLFVNIGEGGVGAAIAHALTSGGDYRAYHNTIATTVGGLVFTSGSTGIQTGGNIISAASSTHINVNNSPTTAISGKQLLYQGGSNVAITWRGSSYTTVASWASDSGQGTGSLQQDPAFVNAPGGDYHMSANVAGVDMSTIAATFASYWGTSLLTDRSGTARPDGVWTMGAYEYSDGGGGGGSRPRALRLLIRGAQP